MDKENSYSCCCFHITTCAKIVAFLGFISAALSIVSVVVAWYYLPFAILSIFIYTFVLLGLQKRRPDYLLPALAIFGIHLFLNLITIILFIVLGAIAAEARLGFFILAGIILAVNIYNVFAFTVIYRTRKYLIATTFSPNNLEQVVTVSPPINASPSPYPPKNWI